MTCVSQPMGRVAGLALLVAFVSGALACSADMKARGYAPSGRDGWQQPDRVVADLGLLPGMRVADLGAGGGYFSFRLAEAVGAEGRVYAIDVDEAMLERLERLARERGVENLVPLQAGAGDSRLPEPVDLVFTSNTYHHLPDRVAYFEALRGKLRPGGRLAVVDFREAGFLQKWLGHATDAALIESELGEAGFLKVTEFGYLERQSFQIFRPL